MKTVLPFLLALLAFAPAALPAGQKPAEASAPAESHPVKGVIMGLLPERHALLVKHEAVPGVMRAMTMMFKVEPEVLSRVKEGDAIEARMTRREDGWWLTGVKTLPADK